MITLQQQQCCYMITLQQQQRCCYMITLQQQQRCCYMITLQQQQCCCCMITLQQQQCCCYMITLQQQQCCCHDNIAATTMLLLYDNIAATTMLLSWYHYSNNNESNDNFQMITLNIKQNCYSNITITTVMFSDHNFTTPTFERMMTTTMDWRFVVSLRLQLLSFWLLFCC